MNRTIIGFIIYHLGVLFLHVSFHKIQVSYWMPNQPELQRTISAGSLALNAMNLTIGAGIFVMPAIVAAQLGPTAFIAYLLCAGLMILVMLCFADIGSKVTTSGGSYAYIEAAFGPYAGFLANMLYWFGFAAIADAAIANAMADMIGTLVPAINIKPVRILFFVLLFGFYAIVNIRGTRSGTRLVQINTILKLLPLAILVLVGTFYVKKENLAIENWPDITSLGELALILFFAYAGAEASLGNSGEIKEPQRSIPKGILMGLAGVLIVYLSIQFVVQGIMGGMLPAIKEAPLAITAQSFMGDFGYYLLLIAAIVSIYGTLSGDILASPRLIYSGGKDRIYPPYFGKLHPKYLSPANAIGFFAVLVTVLSSLGEFRQLALISSSAVLVIYMGVILATIKLKLSKNNNESDSFNLPGGILIPVIAAIAVGWFLWHVTLSELIAMGSFFVIITLFYIFYSRRHINQN
jgi:APA family basic amino acid/polyamine antiporter